MKILPTLICALASAALLNAQDVQVPRHITLAQQTAAAANPLMARLGQLGVEAARQNRLATRADYFPQLNASIYNLHFNKFMGQEITIQRPFAPGVFTAGLPLLGQDLTVVAVTATQPITPLLKVREAVNLARADENIARSKAGLPVTGSARAVDKAFFDLLIAQKQLELPDSPPPASQAARTTSGNALAINVRYTEQALRTTASSQQAVARVKELTASLNELLGWPAETPLELEAPEPLVESLSMQQAVGAAVANNPEIVEAEQNVKKAEAASKISKFDYIPEIAVTGGYIHQANAVPLLPRDFSYIGFIGTYNFFDFGKRGHTILERNAQVQIARSALELTRAKVAAGVKTSYLKLEESRSLHEAALRVESATRVLQAKATAGDFDADSTRAQLSIDILRLDAQHRQAYAELKDIMGQP